MRPEVIAVLVDKWHAKFGRPLRICGWVMIACFAPLLIADLARVVAP